MEDNILLSIARIAVRAGAQVIGDEAEAIEEINGTDIANAIIRSSVDQACEIVSKLGIVDRIDIQRGEFGLIVGIIAREHFRLTEALTGQKLSSADSSLDVGGICVRAYVALLRG